jgi:hypothetical protein
VTIPAEVSIDPIDVPIPPGNVEAEPKESEDRSVGEDPKRPVVEKALIVDIGVAPLPPLSPKEVAKFDVDDEDSEDDVEVAGRGGNPPNCGGISLAEADGGEINDGGILSGSAKVVSSGPLAFVNDGAATAGFLLHVMTCEAKEREGSENACNEIRHLKRVGHVKRVNRYICRRQPSYTRAVAMQLFSR